MEIKVQCPCGQPFKFEVEPVNGQMPCEINCPACNSSATALANAFIVQSLTPKPIAPLAPAAPRSVYQPAAPAPQPARSATMPPRSVSPSPKPAPKPKVQASPETLAFRKGIIGAAIGAALGLAGWFSMIYFLNIEFGWAAWGVGALAGVGARIGGEGGVKLGMIASLFALIAILSGPFLAVKCIINREFNKKALEFYQTEMTFARQALAANTPEETKALIAKHNESDVSEVTDENVENLRKFVAGKPSKSEFIKDVNNRLQAVVSSFSTQLEIMGKSFSLFMILWVFLGVGSAYKIGSGASD